MRWQQRTRCVWLSSITLVAAAFALGPTFADEASLRREIQRVELGARLFSDPRLSADGATSCASCHQPDRAFSDGRALAVGTGSSRGPRNTPSLLDVAKRQAFGWDGRENHLAAQATRPFADPRELGLLSDGELVALVMADSVYRTAFREAFDRPSVDSAQIGAALASYLATLRSERSAFDRHLDGDATALTPAQQRGYALFTGTAGCSGCHRTDGPQPSFTDEGYHRVGVGLAPITERLPQLALRVAGLGRAERERALTESPELAALGRFLATVDPKDIAAYRTPSLRNVALTAPYFHDGSAATLEEAIAQELYYHANRNRANRGLTPVEQADLAAFLRALTGDRWMLKTE